MKKIAAITLLVMSVALVAVWFAVKQWWHNSANNIEWVYPFGEFMGPNENPLVFPYGDFYLDRMGTQSEIWIHLEQGQSFSLSEARKSFVEGLSDNRNATGATGIGVANYYITRDQSSVSFEFKDETLVNIHFWSVAKQSGAPISISRTKQGNRYQFPLTEEELMALFGAPPRVRRLHLLAL